MFILDSHAKILSERSSPAPKTHDMDFAKDCQINFCDISLHFSPISFLGINMIVCLPSLQQFHFPLLLHFILFLLVGPRTATPPSKLLSASGSSWPAMEKSLVESEVQQVKLLDAINDDHGGVIVELSEPMDSDDFASMLRASIAQWSKQGKRGVWIKVPIELVNLVEAAVKEGFWYHHAEPTYLMLIYWIPEGTHTLPANASHRVGVCAFVMNEKREVLVVQEKIGIFRGTGVWKFPTGVLEEGEDICDAAVREVKEETDIDTEFVEVLAFRQSHKAYFEKSDLSFICLLQPLSFDIQKQESEIDAAQWMPLDEYVAQPFVQKSELLKYILEVCLTKIDKKYSGFSPVPTPSNNSDEKGYLYVNRRDLRKPVRSA